MINFNIECQESENLAIGRIFSSIRIVKTSTCELKITKKSFPKNEKSQLFVLSFSHNSLLGVDVIKYLSIIIIMPWFRFSFKLEIKWV